MSHLDYVTEKAGRKRQEPSLRRMSAESCGEVVMNYDQACELYFRWAKNESGDPDVEPMIPNHQISKDVGGTWYLANVCGPLATVSDTDAVQHPKSDDRVWIEVTG